MGIVNEVLEISRIESGQTKLDESVWSIADIVKETDIIIRDQALAKKQEFSIDIWQVQDMCKGNPGQSSWKCGEVHPNWWQHFPADHTETL